jgi:hypothetical protein
MKSALVVYESIFGDTHTIARAVGDGLAATMPVVVMDAREAPEQLGEDVGLLVVGGPTHRFGMPNPSSRAQAEHSMGAKFPSTAWGLREWMHGLGQGNGLPAAAFDLRLTHPGFLRHVDHASQQEESLLRKHGYDVVVPAEHFWVVDASGPLLEGEEARARQWGTTIAERFAMSRT